MAKDKKLLNELVRLAERTEGWSVERSGKQRIVFVGPPGVGKYFAASTPGGHRALKNIKADLRRRGLPC